MVKSAKKKTITKAKAASKLRQYEKEYQEHMNVEASKDKLPFGASRQAYETALDKEYGKWRNEQGSKFCRACFGYGVSLREEQCELCRCGSCGGIKKYTGRDAFKSCC